LNRRLRRELKTIEALIDDFCCARHAAAKGLCLECAFLADYARKRLEKCPFGEEKPTCVNCPVHCYQPKIRDQVREVMRYAGPRMLVRHPILALFHWIDGRRQAPPSR